MIDKNRPLELSDGTPVRFVRSRGIDECSVELLARSTAVPTFRAEQLRYFNLRTGKHVTNTEITLRNRAAFDPKLPMALADGSTVDVRSVSAGEIILNITGGPSHTGKGEDRGRMFRMDGTHHYGELPNLVNVPAPAAGALDLTKPLQTRSGTPVRLIGKLEDGQLVVEVQFMSFDNETRVVPASGRKGPSNVESMDDIINKPVPATSEFMNVYADGTVGTTRHKTVAAAEAGTKYGKVRVGILQRTLRGKELVNAVMLPTTPQLRDYTKTAHNPWA